MLQYERIDASEGTDSNKLNKSKEYVIFHYWYFEEIGYKFEPHVSNKCHDISLIAYELENIAILKVTGVG